MASLAQAVYAALTSALGASVAGVFQDEAPEGTAFPYVVFNQVAAPDAYTFKARSKTTYVVQVSVWDQGNDKTRAEQIAADIDAALTDQPLSVTGHLQTRRDDSFSFTMRENGVAYPQVGGNYRVVVTP